MRQRLNWLQRMAGFEQLLRPQATGGLSYAHGRADINRKGKEASGCGKGYDGGTKVEGLVGRRRLQGV